MSFVAGVDDPRRYMRLVDPYVKPYAIETLAYEEKQIRSYLHD
jgi:hypothetical protein